MRLKRLRASRTRVARGRARRPATLISFWLSARARVVFLVRNAAPDCSPVGRFTVRGRPGQNKVRFTGRLGDRRLRPGKYTISPVKIRRSTPSRRTAVGVAVSHRGSIPAKVSGTCPARTRREELTTSARVDASTPSASRTRTETRKRGKGVLGVLKRPKLTFPEADGTLPWLLRLAALSLVVLSGAAILAYVVRYLRGVNA